MDINNAFEIITGKAEKVLTAKGYRKETVADSEDELTALYIGDLAYSIVYTFSNKRIVLRSCQLEDDAPDNDWKTLATWLILAIIFNQRAEAGICNAEAEKT